MANLKDSDHAIGQPCLVLLWAILIPGLGFPDANAHNSPRHYFARALWLHPRLTIVIDLKKCKQAGAFSCWHALTLCIIIIFFCMSMFHIWLYLCLFVCLSICLVFWWVFEQVRYVSIVLWQSKSKPNHYYKKNLKWEFRVGNWSQQLFPLSNSIALVAWQPPRDDKTVGSHYARLLFSKKW